MGLAKKLSFLGAWLTADEPAQAVDVISPETLVRLQELCNHHTFVDVRFPDRDDEAFQSLILKVDARRKSLLIDELYPLRKGVSIMPGEAVEITSCGGGLPVRFLSTIAAIEMYEDSPAYRVAIPTRLRANQRREFFRVAVNADLDVRLRIPLEGGNLALCEITNLSCSGIGFRIDKNISDQLKSNRRIREAKLNLPDGSSVYCDLEVKSYEYRKPPQRCTVVGARFVNLSSTFQKQMDKFIVQLQRESKKQGSARE